MYRCSLSPSLRFDDRVRICVLTTCIFTFVVLVSSLAQFSDGDSLCSPVSVNMIGHMQSQERENPSDGEEVAAQDGMLAGTISFWAERCRAPCTWKGRRRSGSAGPPRRLGAIVQELKRKRHLPIGAR